MKEAFKKIAPLAIILAVLIGSDLLQAAWTGPTATAPQNNTDAPINTGSTQQVKNGSLGVDALAVYGDSVVTGTTTSNRTHSGQYCDENGENCFYSINVSSTTDSATIVPDWPDAIYCTRTTDGQGRVLFPDYVPTSGFYYYRTPASGNAYISIVFNSDGSFYTETYGPTDCAGKSTNQLGAEGLAVSFGTSPFAGAPVGVPNNWYQQTGASCSQTCSALGLSSTPDPDHGNSVCASGENQIFGKGLNYIYGTWGNGEANGTVDYPVANYSLCYNPYQKRDGDGTDVTIGCYCL